VGLEELEVEPGLVEEPVEIGGEEILMRFS